MFNLLEEKDVVMCISNYKTMKIGSYAVVKKIDGELAEVEIASRVRNTGAYTTIMNISDIVKVGKLF